jgi:hypothetical protein
MRDELDLALEIALSEEWVGVDGSVARRRPHRYPCDRLKRYRQGS